MYLTAVAPAGVSTDMSMSLLHRGRHPPQGGGVALVLVVAIVAFVVGDVITAAYCREGRVKARLVE